MKKWSLSYILEWTFRIGIAASAVLLTVGLVMYLFFSAYPMYESMINAGIYVLLATPVTSVALAALVFAYEKNAIYTVITTIVFIDMIIAIFVLPHVVHV